MIQTYTDILPKDFCEYLMKRFDEQDNKDSSHGMFEQIEIDWKEEVESLIATTKRVADHYRSVYDPCGMMPYKRRIEGFRIKRYTPHVHRFPLHVDASSLESCTRYLAFLFYLNDSEAGTRFYGPLGMEPLTIEAKQGNLLVFPPMWMFPHEGIMPTEKPKYIMSTYFHYV